MVSHLAVLDAIQRKYKCPYLTPIRREIAVATDGAQLANLVALVVFFAGLLGGQGKAPQRFLEGRRRFEHCGGSIVPRASGRLYAVEGWWDEQSK
jgi:hypothetical protein